jgi:hypothetical protein
MKSKVKCILTVFALVAATAVQADYTLTGTITQFSVTTVENNGSIRFLVSDPSNNCGPNGPIAILRTGTHLGSDPTAAAKTYANMQATILAAKLSNLPVTVTETNDCSMTSVTLN